MKNIINYYYNLNPEKINHLFQYYYFYLQQELYYFVIYENLSVKFFTTYDAYA